MEIFLCQKIPYILTYSLKLDPGLEQACQKDLQKFCSNRVDVDAVECLKESFLSSTKYLTKLQFLNDVKNSSAFIFCLFPL